MVRTEGPRSSAASDRRRGGGCSRTDRGLPARGRSAPGEPDRPPRVVDTGRTAGAVPVVPAGRMSTRPATAAAVLRVVAAATCWGLAAVMAKVAFDRGVPPVRMAEARVAVGVAVSLQYTAPVLLLGLAAMTARRRPELRPRRLAWVAAPLTMAGAVQ